MAGLSDISKTVDKTETQLPSWYTTAQQNINTAATTANAPALSATTGGAAALDAFKTGQPFDQAASTLNAIASGAANPWTVTTDATGNQVVNPNVATPLGGLFKAQTDYLTSMMPDISAKSTGQGISGGGFGSSMNLGALSRARSQAINQLLQQQNQAALQAQQTGASAASSLGNLGQAELQGALNLATAEQADPYVNAINRANILSKLPQPKTEIKTTTPNIVDQIGGLSSLIKSGRAGLDAVMKSSLGVGAKNLLKDLFKQEGVDTTGWVQDPTTGLYYLEGETPGGGSEDTGEPFEPYYPGVEDDIFNWDLSLDQPYQDSDELVEFDSGYDVP